MSNRLYTKLKAFWNQYRNFIIVLAIACVLAGMFIFGPLLASLAPVTT